MYARTLIDKLPYLQGVVFFAAVPHCIIGPKGMNKMVLKYIRENFNGQEKLKTAKDSLQLLGFC